LLLLHLVEHRGGLRLVEVLLRLGTLHLLLDDPLGKLGSKPHRVSGVKVPFKKLHVVAA
jgi:hypothetical protein